MYSVQSKNKQNIVFFLCLTVQVHCPFQSTFHFHPPGHNLVALFLQFLWMWKLICPILQLLNEGSWPTVDTEVFVDDSCCVGIWDTAICFSMFPMFSVTQVSMSWSSSGRFCSAGGGGLLEQVVWFLLVFGELQVPMQACHLLLLTGVDSWLFPLSASLLLTPSHTS